MNQPQNPMITLYILWGALLSSTLMILGMTFVIKVPPSEDFIPLLAVFGVASLSVAGMSLWLPAKTAIPALQKLSVATREIEDPASLPGSGRTVRVPVDPSAALATLVKLSQTPFILRVALGESIALFGFVLYMRGAPHAYVLPFFVVCWLLHVLAFPSQQGLLRFAQKHTGIRFDLSSTR